MDRGGGDPLLGGVIHIVTDQQCCPYAVLYFPKSAHGKNSTVILLMFTHANALTVDITVTTTPLLKDLYEHITPQYAADWKEIGTLLGVPSGELRNIEADFPTDVKRCCNKMLEEWLELDPSASWRKLIKVIESPAVSSNQISARGKLILSRIKYYIDNYILKELFSQRYVDFYGCRA